MIFHDGNVFEENNALIKNIARIANMSNFKLIYFGKYAHNISITHLGDTTAQMFTKRIKMFVSHHGLKVLQQVMLNLLILGHPGTLRYIEIKFANWS